MDRANIIKISGVICTYRRPEMLKYAMESLLRQTLPSEQYEVIVIDNNSGDKTYSVVRNYQNRAAFPIIYFLEERQGLSTARNTGIQHARGEYIAFLDDDAEADPDWLSSFVKVFERVPQAWVVGGKILPIWDAKRPSWLTDDLLNNYSLLDLGETPCFLEWPEHVLGTSCFRRSVFDEIGWFEPLLGRSGYSLVGDEDSEIQHRLIAAGKRVFYAPQAIAWHHILPQRLTKHYIYTRAYGTGKSRAVMICQPGNYGFIVWNFFRALLGLGYYYVTLLWTIWDELKRIKTIRSIYTKLGYLNQIVFFLLRKHRE
jgi:glycosyltransferase involved in cell wall biosynthesis